MKSTCLEIIEGKKTRRMHLEEFREKIPAGFPVEIDIGTGDGKFVYESARKHPDRFFIGIDSERVNLEKNSRKIGRKPEKGGLSNALFVIANVESLPTELNGLASRVWVILPWGSLLRAVATGETETLSRIRNIMVEKADLHIYQNYDIRYEKAEMEKRGIPQLNIDYVNEHLKPKYEAGFIRIEESYFFENEKMKRFPSTWAKRLAFGRFRNTLYIRAVALPTH